MISLNSKAAIFKMINKTPTQEFIVAQITIIIVILQMRTRVPFIFPYARLQMRATRAKKPLNLLGYWRVTVIESYCEVGL
jgi:hypothetical protein